MPPDDARIVLQLIPAESIREYNVSVVRDQIEQGNSVIVVTTSFPAQILEKLYAAEGIDPDRVFFVDAITQHSMGTAPPADGRIRSVSNPTDLTGMGMAITALLGQAGGKPTAILFDSVSTLLIYLPAAQVSRFMHFVTSKIRLQDVSGVILAVQKGIDPLLLSQLTAFVDEVRVGG
ncbi:MAG: DUF7504 family protein [Methanomicrobiales archaeon]